MVGDRGQVGRLCPFIEVWPRARLGDLSHPRAASAPQAGGRWEEPSEERPAAAGPRATRRQKPGSERGFHLPASPFHAPSGLTVFPSFLFAFPSSRCALSTSQGWREDKKARSAQVLEDLCLVSFLSSDRCKLHCCNFPSHSPIDSGEPSPWRSLAKAPHELSLNDGVHALLHVLSPENTAGD